MPSISRSMNAIRLIYTFFMLITADLASGLFQEGFIFNLVPNPNPNPLP